MKIDATTVFTILAPLLLLLGAFRCITARRWIPQGRTWLTIGILFAAVALWLRHSVPAA